MMLQQNATKAMPNELNMLITCYRWEKDANKQCKWCCYIGVDFIMQGAR